MLISRKLLTVAAGFSALMAVQALNSLEVVMKNAEYAAQGFNILSRPDVEGYSVRIKQPKSCEEGIQVNICSNYNRYSYSIQETFSTRAILISTIQTITFSFTFSSREPILQLILLYYG
jgi:hypothetical protein